MSRTPVKRGAVGPADLIDLDVFGDADPSLAEFVGFEYRPRSRKPTAEELYTPQSPTPNTPPRTFEPYVAKPAVFIVPKRFRAIKNVAAPDIPEEIFIPEWPDAPANEPITVPLADPARISKLLSRIRPDMRKGRALDVDRVVSRLSRAKPLKRLPRKEFPHGRVLQIVVDRSPRLAPIWNDQFELLTSLEGDGIHVWRLDDVAMRLRSVADKDRASADPNEGPLIALTDLGAFGGKADRKFWRELALDFVRRGGDVLALVPCDPDDIHPDLAALWSPIAWEEPLSDVALRTREDDVEELLALASPASRLEPGLLRALRRSCTSADAATELLVWGHEAISSPNAGAASFDPNAIGSYRRQFVGIARRDEARAKRAWEIIRSWRGRIGYEFMFEEIFDLPKDVRERIVDPADIEAGQAFWDQIGAAAARGSLQPKALTWLRGSGHRRNAQSGSLRAHSGALNALKIAQAVNSVPRQFSIAQRGSSITLSEDPKGSPLGLLQSSDESVELIGRDKTSFPPALTAFHDRLSDGALGPEMISIPTGSFLIGSPEEEKGRHSDEGPQHRIELQSPFALGKYPVTFDEYDAFCAATGRKVPEDDGWGRGRRPVINVSWADAKAFCDWLSSETDRIYRLPSEAEWEYACRAGTTSAYWWGDSWDPSQANAALEHGQTTPVGEYPTNPWGMADMHGNVWEWCADAGSDSHDGIDLGGAPRPVSEQEKDQDRPVRGGSWRNGARYLRAAYRRRGAPEARNNFLGFRCASVHAGPAGQGGRDDRGSGREAEPGPEPLTAARSNHARISPGRGAKLPLPQGPFLIRSDRAEIEFERITKSDLGWASALGRDRYGLWSRFEIEDVETPLRWIPPGRFTIGSPKDEPGRLEYEGPQTEIMIAEGFWLMDAPVTQALWRTVMGGENPSQFVSPNRPVEQVSWQDAQSFARALTKRLEGLTLGLPSEAQWEYACRAGTLEATYAGPMEIKGDNNAPVLNDVAWYGGNSGVDFDLEKGHDSSNWAEKAFEHSEAGTRLVCLKKPNPWGCHDMLGNVWEWCADAFSDSHEGIDPTGAPRPVSQQEKDAPRAVRGGSWADSAHDLRAAYRNGYAPELRNSALGFRCASVQASQASTAGQDDPLRSGREAEPGPDASASAGNEDLQNFREKPERKVE